MLVRVKRNEPGACLYTYEDEITKEEEIIIITRTKEKEAEIKRKKIRKKMGK